jgi:uncharacterized RDD family membrane protein YckC
MNNYNDEIDFKPLNEGLGFHQAQESMEKFNIAKRNIISNNRIVEMTPKENFISPIMKEKNKPQLMQSDLSMFYGHSTNVENIEVQSSQSELIEATTSQRFTAFVIDMIVLAMITIFTFFIIDAIVDLNYISKMKELNQVYLSSTLILFSIYFLIYFSLCDKSSVGSFGKSVIELRVINSSKTNASLTLLFVRNLFCLLSFLSLGLFALVDLPSKITSTKVVKSRR